MQSIYVASTEAFVGKSAVCLMLLRYLQERGQRVGYMKPVSVTVRHTESHAYDEDAVFIRETLGLGDPLELMTPILVTPSKTEQVLRGEKPDFSGALRTAYEELARAKDVLVLEGTNSWAEGALIDLSADQVAAMLGSPVLLVSRYRSTLAVDAILAVRRFLAARLLGVLLNQVPAPQISFVRSSVVPFLERQGIAVFGLIPSDPLLGAVTIDELAEHLGAEILVGGEHLGRLVESLMVGAMGVESALSHFRRRSNKAVITGGDRSDLQLAALETSTACLILTGNIRPSPVILDRAEQRGTAVLLVPEDTLTIVERAEEIFGHVRFHQPGKLDRFAQLFEEHVDRDRLLQELRG